MTLKIAHIYPFSPQVLNYSDRDWESSQVPLGANRVRAEPHYRLQLGQNGRRRVQQYFNFEQRYASVKQLYLNQ